MGKTRFAAVLLLSALIAAVTGACIRTPVAPTAQRNENTESNDTVTTLRFISSWGGVDSKAETLKSVLKQFERDNPDIVVKNESLFGEDFLPKIKTDFASGYDPEVFGLWPGSDINMLINAGKVADLTDLLEDDPEWKSSFNPEMWSYTTTNGRVYGLPFEVIFECIFINKDLFDKYKAPVPESYEELKEAVLIFRENNITPIAFNTYAEGTYLYQNLVAIIGGKEDTENPFENGRVKQSLITAMQYVKELYDMGAFPEDCFTMTNNERNMLFKNKKAAMIVQGSWFIGEFPASDLTVDIIPFPVIKGYEDRKDTMVYGLGGGSFHMSALAAEDNKKYDASVRLLKALTSPETALIFANETGMISNVKLDDKSIRYMRMAVKGNNMVEQSRFLVGPLDHFVDRASWEEDIAKQFPYFLSGKITAEEMWARAIENGIIP
ncbi:MAG: ABC transporter substrate-binding protein [Bacillota bacterium]